MSSVTPWMDAAACRRHDPELWFQHAANGNPLRRLAAAADAVHVCRGCPVRWQCALYAAARPPAEHPFGVWGGFPPGTWTDPRARAAAVRLAQQQLQPQHGAAT